MSSVYIDVTFICLQLLALLNPSAASDIRCKYTKQHGYITADCSNLNLLDIPNNLIRPDTEVLDLSGNRLRELKNDTFRCCTSIKLLYLNLNSIFEIHSHAFSYLSDLITLDLSYNVLLQVPQNLPSSLNRLYIDVNPKLFSSKPEIAIAPLKQLIFLSISDNGLKKFPSFGGLTPNIIEINATKNNFEDLTPEDLAPLCRLQFLHLSVDGISKFKNRCDCSKLAQWISDRGIKGSEFKCSYDREAKCESTLPSNSTMEKYNACLVEFKNRQIPYWLMFGGGISALIIAVFVATFVLYRRRKRQSSGSRPGSRNTTVQYENNKSSDENSYNCNYGFNGGYLEAGRLRSAGGIETTV